MSNKKLTIDVSTATLLKILLIVVLVAVAIYLREVLMLFFIALILASAINPWVDWFQKKHLPRSISIMALYILAFALIFCSAYLLIGPITSEIKNLSADFPSYWQNISSGWRTVEAFSISHGLQDNIQNSFTSLQESLTALASNIFGGVLSLFGSIFSILVVLVMTFYLAVYDSAMKKSIRGLFPAQYQPYFMHLVTRMQDKIGLWLRGQMLLSFIIFVMCLLGLSVLGVKYAWVLALFAGITEIIPYFGPFLGAIPAVFIAFTYSPSLGFAVLVLYIIIQQLENYLIVPLVMKKAVGLNPVVVIVAMLIGSQVAGIPGIILAVPVTTALGVIVGDILKHREGASIDEEGE